ncbi:hypothetical protein IJG29_00600 [Candidatus Saccharibacteria bacterium]|nr:hypothetical protein [Candidatus Saccharibacteria bacterium]
MTEKQYLNEAKYQKAEKRITLLSLFILVIGLLLGGFLIYRGIAKPSTATIEELTSQLQTKKQELQSRGIQYSEFTTYSDGEAYDLKIITNALDPSFPHCNFSEYQDNPITKDYCAAKTNSSSFASKSSVMIGIFVCIATCMISGTIFAFAKRRHILAFSTQQVMPVAKEGIEEITPTVSNAAGKITEEITKGVKKGLKNNSK